MRSIELFAGAGGLALGSAQAGFNHEVVVERDKDACDTIRANQQRGIAHVRDWSLFQGDATTYDYSCLSEGIDILVAGPPCQPFSMGGKHGSIGDPRNMFPEVARAARAIRPRAMLVENVKGLLRASFTKHFEYILLQLSYPEITRRADENWMDHLSRLEQYQTNGRHDGLFYRIVFQLLDAADYGVPQRRHRVFMVGFRSDQNVKWSFPAPTHSRESLLRSQAITGDYWKRHRIRRRDVELSPTLLRRFGELRAPTMKPWLTVRDAISDLPCPRQRGDRLILNHRLQVGARRYPGHTGSDFDMPAKALKAGDHGVPGGENMLANPDGTVRYFTVRESGRLQCFPDDYEFKGSWTETMRQLGNAVPVSLARVVARSISSTLAGTFRPTR